MKKPPLSASLLAFLGVMILCTLGLWQIQRLHWKQGLLHEIEAAWQAAPESLSAGQLAAAQTQGRKFLRGVVHGTYLNDAAITVGPRVLHEQQGAHLITPLALDDHTILLVNRGWVPLSQDDDTMAIAGPVAVTGLLRLPDQNNFFTPANDPAKQQWYTIDPQAIAKTHDLKGVLPFIMIAEGSPDETHGKEFPLAIGGKPDLNNNHLSYAFFWFAMAGVLIVVFVIRFVLGRP